MIKSLIESLKADHGIYQACRKWSRSRWL